MNDLRADAAAMDAVAEASAAQAAAEHKSALAAVDARSQSTLNELQGDNAGLQAQLVESQEREAALL
jgi:hypothetical protein